MIGQGFQLTPIDTLFFRDSRPFDKGPLQSSAETVFPPPGRTLAGALRLALARGQGYDGRGRWSNPQLVSTLGSGPNNLGKLRFCGPFLALGGELLYPMPLQILGKRDPRTDEREAEVQGDRFQPTTRLTPGDEVLCDLGRARLPVPDRPSATLDSGARFYLRREGLLDVLAGGLPSMDTIVAPQALFEHESRIGLERDPSRRTAKTGLLYSATHLRLRDRVSIFLAVEGVPDRWAAACPKVIPLGGESRMADLALVVTPTPIGAPLDAIRESGRVTITLLTPLRMRREKIPGPGCRHEIFAGAEVVSACLGKPIFLGGWDSAERAPLPLRPYLPAGSTWFCTVDNEAVEAVAALHGATLDPDEGALGYGAVALGTWNDPKT